jgi:hypothetical protein
MKLVLAVVAALALSISACKSDDKAADKPNESSEPESGNPDQPSEPDQPTDPDAPDESGGNDAGADADEAEVVPTQEDFEEQASTEITEKNLEDEVTKLEKELKYED